MTLLVVDGTITNRGSVEAWVWFDMELSPMSYQALFASTAACLFFCVSEIYTEGTHKMEAR